jgi:Xaa-Pro aminopeptidase
MDILSFNSEFFKGNRHKTGNLLKANALAVLFSNDQMPRNGDQFYPYRQDSDFYYLTGIEQEKSILILYPNCPVEKYREVLFLIRPDENLERWEGKKLRKDEATAISDIKTIVWLDEFESVLRECIHYSETVYLNTNEQLKFNPDVSSRSHRLGKQILDQYPLFSIKRLAPLLSNVRQLKTPEEHVMIKNACSITSSAFNRIAKFIRADVNEREVQAEMEHEFTIRGAKGHAFHPIVASGKNATFLHYNYNRDVCKDGDLLLIDFGCELNNYASDLSRTIPVNGKFTERQKEVYSSVLKVYKEIIPLFTAGNSISSIHHKTCSLIEHELVELGLVKKIGQTETNGEPSWFKYFPHGISHHIGLDVHDPGHKQDPLRENMVVSCEPGIYIPEENIGIRIETDLLITKDHPIDFFENLALEIDEIETLMKK